jgi:hypothetical protein
MYILLWVAVAIVVANVIFGAVLLVRFRAERRGVEARHRRTDSEPWKLGSSRST